MLTGGSLASAKQFARSETPSFRSVPSRGGTSRSTHTGVWYRSIPATGRGAETSGPLSIVDRASGLGRLPAPLSDRVKHFRRRENPVVTESERYIDRPCPRLSKLSTCIDWDHTVVAIVEDQRSLGNCPHPRVSCRVTAARSPCAVTLPLQPSVVTRALKLVNNLLHRDVKIDPREIHIPCLRHHRHGSPAGSSFHTISLVSSISLLTIPHTVAICN